MAFGTGNNLAANAVAMVDVTDDSCLDVLIANYGSPNQLYIGNCTGGFTEVTEGPFVAKRLNSFAMVTADLNGDLHVSNSANAPHAVQSRKVREPSRSPASFSPLFTVFVTAGHRNWKPANSQSNFLWKWQR